MKIDIRTGKTTWWVMGMLIGVTYCIENVKDQSAESTDE